MQKIFRKNLCKVVIVSMAVIMLLCYLLLGYNLRSQKAATFHLLLTQVESTLQENERELANLTESVHEDYLTRARAFRYIINHDPSVLESPEELEKIRLVLGVDELHVIDGDGILRYGTIPKYVGMEFASTDQTREFLSLLDESDGSLVQDIQPNGAEKKLFQYAGVSRGTEPGVVQIGMAPTRLLEAQKYNTLSYIFSRIPTNPGESLFAVDLETGEIEAHTNSELAGRNISEFHLTKERLAQMEDGAFFQPNGTEQFMVVRFYGNRALGASISRSELYAGRTLQLLLIFALLIANFLVAMAAINRIVRRRIVDGVQEIVQDLEAITHGNLDTEVRVDSNPEFRRLSNGINQMVTSILGTTAKVSQIMDIVDLDIGVFECHQDMNRVIATERLRQVLALDTAQAEEMYQDKRMFLEFIQEIMARPEPGEDSIYQLMPGRWVEIHTTESEDGSFGVVCDMTPEIRQKRAIRFELDHDALTRLHTYRVFQAKSNAVLRRPLGVCAGMMMDLDHFKSINDQYGHDFGDQYLRHFASILQLLDGNHAITARRSGDEFCVFFHGYPDADRVREEIRRLYQELSHRPLPFPDGIDRIIQASAGLTWRRDSAGLEQIMREADAALYTAKEQSPNDCYESNQPE